MDKVVTDMQPQAGPGIAEMGRHPAKKRWMPLISRLLGWAAAGASIYFLIDVSLGNLHTFKERRFGLAEAGWMASGALLYGLLMFCLTAGWAEALAGVMGRRPTIVAAVNVHCRSMIAKYLPGNVFQYVTRQVLGHSYGWPQVAIALTSVVEAVMMFAAVTLVTAIWGLIAQETTPFGPSHAMIWIAMLTTIAPWLVVIAAGYTPFLRRRFTLDEAQRVLRSPHLVWGLLFYVLFFFGHGGVAWMLYDHTGTNTTAELAPGMIFGYFAAWIIGFLSPGAPGGLGVREACIVLLLQHKIGRAEALYLAALTRVMTSGGDVIHFMLGMLFVRLKSRAQAMAA